MALSWFFHQKIVGFCNMFFFWGIFVSPTSWRSWISKHYKTLHAREIQRYLQKFLGIHWSQCIALGKDSPGHFLFLFAYVWCACCRFVVVVVVGGGGGVVVAVAVAAALVVVRLLLLLLLLLFVAVAVAVDVATVDDDADNYHNDDA